jgi:hypothetical protein
MVMGSSKPMWEIQNKNKNLLTKPNKITHNCEITHNCKTMQGTKKDKLKMCHMELGWDI